MNETSSLPVKDKNGNGGLRFDFTINLSHVIAFVTFVGVSFSVYLGLQNQMSELRAKYESLKQAYDYQTADIKQLRDARTADVTAFRDQFASFRLEQRETDNALRTQNSAMLEQLTAMRVVIAGRNDKR